MAIETIRISRRAKQQLIQLKRATGQKSSSVLFNWAYCASLADPTPPTAAMIHADSSVEMSLRGFGGAHTEIYLAILRMRCIRGGLPSSDEALAAQLGLHIHRGIGYLVTDRKMRGVCELLRRVIADS